MRKKQKGGLNSLPHYTPNSPLFLKKGKSFPSRKNKRSSRLIGIFNVFFFFFGIDV
jgi:hypothetical protein